MIILKRHQLVDFWTRHPDAETHLKAWFAEAQKATWKNPQDIKKRYQNASIIGNRVIFTIRGTLCRLIVAVRYESGIVLIRFLEARYE